MQNRTVILVFVFVVIAAVLAFGHRSGGGNMLHRLGAAIHGR